MSARLTFILMLSPSVPFVLRHNDTSVFLSQKQNVSVKTHNSSRGCVVYLPLHLRRRAPAGASWLCLHVAGSADSLSYSLPVYLWTTIFLTLLTLSTDGRQRYWKQYSSDNKDQTDSWEVPRSVSAAITSVSSDLGLSLICVLRLKKKMEDFYVGTE